MSLLRSFLFLLVLLFARIDLHASDTISVFLSKIAGEDIQYFSPMRQFASKAILTRANGQMAVAWNSMPYHGEEKFVTYEFLIGHSTGTSSGVRHFNLSLNGEALAELRTEPGKRDYQGWSGKNGEICAFSFQPLEYDVNKDVFGFLRITVPAEMVRSKAEFRLMGADEQSRDWMMVFVYSRNLKWECEVTGLVLRSDQRRQMNLYLDFPNAGNHQVEVIADTWRASSAIRQGFNKLSFSSWPADYAGGGEVKLVVDARDTLRQHVDVIPVKSYDFHIIHHSHNDIGYSHLQTEVERIQSENIRSAMRWASRENTVKSKAVWHIESLWAVENFLRTASRKETDQFVKAVKSGSIVLSANYANILTGLCQPEEQLWALEYASQLEKKYGLQIRNVMITDIPGISWSALKAYTDRGIPYLSIGPNYIDTQPDRGDRVGGIIREQGDKIYYWKPDAASDQKLLVWTAGKGYSYFHSITEEAQLAGWESRISRYCQELSAGSYPYDIVQLRYTKNADNGPVDTNLCRFVDEWNERYTSPHLVISNLNNLFSEMEKRHGAHLPVVTGELSPYWEDGAYSTAAEEIENRELVLQTIAMEKFAREKKLYQKHEARFYDLRKNIVLFHEHTWGSWCSISDPEIAFTTEQWKIKKSFLDSASSIYQELARRIGFHFVMPERKSRGTSSQITDFEIDPQHGGLSKLMAGSKNLIDEKAEYGFLEMIYSTGTDPSVLHRTSRVSAMRQSDNEFEKIVQVNYKMDHFSDVFITYVLFRKTGVFKVYVSFNKDEVREKESLHFAMPLALSTPELRYGSETHMVKFNEDQLPGSNKDFVCLEDRLEAEDAHWKFRLYSPEVNLVEVGSIIDESRVSGAKVWKKENLNTSHLFLYVLNNYWHTNFKAWQSGKIEFEISIEAEHKHP